MKLQLVLLATLVTVAVAQKEKRETYTIKLDNVYIDEILKSDRLLRSYFNCFMDRGRCTVDGKDLKDNLSDALKSDCSKCSKKQSESIDKIMKYLIENNPTYWNDLEKKYDPTGEYRKKSGL
ncbi:ejaculatory bulb-specific protein 3-like [Neocloeon triangulifer]|uniref:ejaculatory bulb-specific protein 3-like n=1 Tax=Neocloeon triangulifer TaxID=2078957 RepID=UPI00286F24C2|nr:ejaculatory bulb-specific protein 3-like [Neocloeon triangulifer]